jgi:hypothetical protein
MARAFLVQAIGAPESDLRRSSDELFLTIQAAAAGAGFRLVRADLIAGTGLILNSIYRELGESDVVIADLTSLNPNVMYELGFAHGAQRPTVMLAASGALVPFDVAGVRTLIYEPSISGLRALQETLQQSLTQAVANPEAFRVPPPHALAGGKSIFLSYSHTDAGVLARLLVHLRPLEKAGLIDVWNDTRLEAGDDWKKEVDLALASAAAAVLLVSADFLASDFIVDNELPPLLESAEAKGTRIIPIIVKPCRYTRDPVLRRIQAINDPTRPLAALSDVEQEAVLDTVALTVERAVAAAS